MSLQSVRAYLAERAPDVEILAADTSTATVALAAEAHGVAPAQIAKTLALHLGGDAILVVMSGTARLDNRKFKARFGAKAKMLDADEVLAATGHPVGGVCPFGLPRPLRVYADASLRSFDVVVPAAGDTHHAIRIATGRLVALVAAEWVDVAQDDGGGADNARTATTGPDMSDTQHLQAAIADLRAQIAALDPADTATREHLSALAADIERRLGAEPQGRDELDASLNASVLRFEASHPKIATVLNQLAEKLGTMGI